MRNFKDISVFSSIKTVLIAASVIASFAFVAYEYNSFHATDTTDIDDSASITNELKAEEDTDATLDFEIYRNQIYGFEIKYPQGWHYAEFQPKLVTTSYDEYNCATKKYEHRFVKENTDFAVAFGPTDNLMPTVSRGGDGYISISVYEGGLDKLVKRDFERNSLIQRCDDAGQTTTKYDAYKDQYLGEIVTIGGMVAYREITKGWIPDALDGYDIIVSRVENKQITASIIMGNIDHVNGIEDVYNQMVNSFYFLDS